MRRFERGFCDTRITGRKRERKSTRRAIKEEDTEQWRKKITRKSCLSFCKVNRCRMGRVKKKKRKKKKMKIGTLHESESDRVSE